MECDKSLKLIEECDTLHQKNMPNAYHGMNKHNSQMGPESMILLIFAPEIG